MLSLFPHRTISVCHTREAGDGHAFSVEILTSKRSQNTSVHHFTLIQLGLYFEHPSTKLASLRFGLIIHGSTACPRLTATLPVKRAVYKEVVGALAGMAVGLLIR